MTIDEAITRFENNANFEQTHGNLQGCLEFRQLAEWLRELKKYRTFKEVLYKKCDEWCKFPEYRERGTMCGACEIGGIKDLLENALEEVKADAESEDK